MLQNDPPHHRHRSSDSHHHQSPHPSSYSHIYSSNSIEPNPSSEDYPQFHMHSNLYTLIIVNNETSIDTWNTPLNHVQKCKQYSVDTESDRRNNRLSLIQVNTIPSDGESLVLLFEMNHFPTRTSSKYEKVRKIFQLIFREKNEIYS